ncbi:hypothetical protein [Natronospora cellulosivora (SeqCode)]
MIKIKLKYKSIFLTIIIIILSFISFAEEYYVSGKVLDYITGAAVEDIVLYFEIENSDEILSCKTDENGEWNIILEISDQIQDTSILITPKSDEEKLKFSPPHVFLSNDKKLKCTYYRISIR